MHAWWRWRSEGTKYLCERDKGASRRGKAALHAGDFERICLQLSARARVCACAFERGLVDVSRCSAI